MSVVLGGALACLLIGLVAVVAWFGWENEQAALRNRDGCGLGQDVFAHPSSVGVTGWQDPTYTYRYDDQTGAWIDANVLPSFHVRSPVDDLPLAPQSSVTGRDEVPPTSGAGNHLVWSSPARPSEKGLTTFDVYRMSDGDGYELIVQCSTS